MVRFVASPYALPPIAMTSVLDLLDINKFLSLGAGGIVAIIALYFWHKEHEREEERLEDEKKFREEIIKERGDMISNLIEVVKHNTEANTKLVETTSHLFDYIRMIRLSTLPNRECDIK